MLTERLIGVGLGFMDAILNFLDILPAIPEEIVEVLDWFFTTIFDYGWNAACFFLPMKYVLVLIPLAIAVDNFSHIYHLLMWVLRKIPFVGIE